MLTKPATITDIIHYLQNHLHETDITLHDGAWDSLIEGIEEAYGFTLPDDFKTFYQFTDGFEREADIFNLISLDYALECKYRFNEPGFQIAEYMIHCDSWMLEVNPDNPNDYIIYNKLQYREKMVLTKSFAEFLQRVIQGGVFEAGGLYEWGDEVWKSGDNEK